MIIFNQLHNTLPAASFLMYAFNAVLNWLEFSNARHTFLIWGGISSIIPGSHSGGGLTNPCNGCDWQPMFEKAKITAKSTAVINCIL